MNCDLSELDISKVSYFYGNNCSNLYGDLTNWLTVALDYILYIFWLSKIIW